MPQEMLFRQVLDPSNRADPYPLYARLRERPVCRQGDGTYVVSTYREVARLLGDPRVSSDDRNRRDDGALPRLADVDKSFSENRPFVALDPPEHDRARQVVMRGYGPPRAPDRVEGLRERVDAIADQLIDAQRGRRRLDVVESVAYPLPAAAIADLLGVPSEDGPRLRGWSAMLVRAREAGPDGRDGEQMRRVGDSLRQLSAYMGELIAARRRRPGDDLVSALIDPAASQPLDDEKAVTTAVMLLVAGFETTVNLIANGFLTLLRHPEELDRLRRDPERVFGLVEEVLRYESPVQFLARTTLAKVELDGVTIPRGAPVVLLLASANRDPARFPLADRFVPDRADNQHLAFGGGIHYCLGAPLARLEAQVALTELARRLVAPRLVDDPPPFRSGPLRGPAELLVDVERIAD